MRKPLKRGDQIAYIPLHANNDISHPDVELGFVTSVCSNEDAFCRYWSKSNPNLLRTRANSERTPGSYLVPFVSHPQQFVNELLAEIDKEA